MKLSKEQSCAVFSSIEKELNVKTNKLVRERKSRNEKVIAETIEKFKKTAEYKAVMLLAKTFKNLPLADCAKKDGIESLARRMFKPKLETTHLYIFDERKTIEILAIDCKNLAELKEKIN